MTAIVESLTAEHRCCDERFTATEAAAERGEAGRCREAFQQFQTAMELHFRKEEEALFPAFEQMTGNSVGPTRVMRLEHRQMRDALAEMRATLARGDLEEFLGQSETLLILMQQHNIKEEQMLYPMCDRVLGAGATSVIGAMQALPADKPT